MDRTLISAFFDANEPYRINNDFLIVDNPLMGSLLGERIKTKRSVILYCITGQVNMVVNNRPVELSASQVVYLAKDQYIEVNYVSQDIESSMMLLSDRFVNSLDLKHMLYFSSIAGYVIISPAHGSYSHFEAVCKDIIANDTNPEKLLVIELIIKAYLISLSHYGDSYLSSLSTNGSSSAIMSKFFELLQSQKKIQRSSRYYAEQLCISDGHLSHVARHFIGHSATFLINQAIIENARKLLSDASLSIMQVADILDFSNPSAFGRFFKKMTGYTPSEFRKHIHNHRLIVK